MWGWGWCSTAIVGATELQACDGWPREDGVVKGGRFILWRLTMTCSRAFFPPAMTCSCGTHAQFFLMKHHHAQTDGQTPWDVRLYGQTSTYATNERLMGPSHSHFVSRRYRDAVLMLLKILPWDGSATISKVSYLENDSRGLQKQRSNFPRSWNRIALVSGTTRESTVDPIPPLHSR
jgi:hypothetical protein